VPYVLQCLPQLCVIPQWLTPTQAENDVNRRQSHGNMSKTFAHDALDTIPSNRSSDRFFADGRSHTGHCMAWTFSNDDNKRADVTSTSTAPYRAVIFSRAYPLQRPESTRLSVRLLGAFAAYLTVRR